MAKEIKQLFIVAFITILLMIFCAISHATSYSDGSGTLTIADTTDDYTILDTVTWNCSEYRDKTVIVRNTGSYPAVLRVKLNAYYGGLEYTLQEGTLDASADTIIYFEPYFQIIDIAVKDDATSTSVVIDWGGSI